MRYGIHLYNRRHVQMLCVCRRSSLRILVDCMTLGTRATRSVSDTSPHRDGLGERYSHTNALFMRHVVSLDSLYSRFLVDQYVSPLLLTSSLVEIFQIHDFPGVLPYVTFPRVFFPLSLIPVQIFVNSAPNWGFKIYFFPLSNFTCPLATALHYVKLHCSDELFPALRLHFLFFPYLSLFLTFLSFLLSGFGGHTLIQLIDSAKFSKSEETSAILKT